ncbi:MAG: hypothetical protein CL840_12035 [Crocinitomicaceae bacterium]|nr:hypothetical protein [Crocinitomicaceae bacterium]|tara:strand:- start:9159 stop:10265 length:1107 start_codon:yes stop_codon:yes gene_type:complete
MSRSLVVVSCFLSLIVVLISCNKNEDITSQSGTELSLPDVDYRYAQNDKITKIGRVLFYDKSLSANNSTSCGSCHKQHLAFADDSRLSPGFDNRIGNRNTPPIQNLRIGSQLLFWDGRESNLLNMVTQPVFNHVEMGIRSDRYLLNNVKSKPYYEELFREAYRDGEITLERISESLAFFVSSLISINSGFDLPNEMRPSDVNEGEKLFFGKYNCGNCHNIRNPKGYDGGDVIEVDSISLTVINEPLRTNSPMINIGLDLNYKDKGLGELTYNPGDNGKFKIPNLRNVSLTSPYMHDGRYKTLDEVLDFYSRNINNHPNLDSKLKSLKSAPQSFNISAKERKQLISFLESLTDHSFITDPKFSDPFINR